MPGIVLPPPGSVRLGTVAWRRWFVASMVESGTGALEFLATQQVLTEETVRAHRMSTNRAAALLSLLIGALEIYGPEELTNLSEVVATESKIIALARARIRRRVKAFWAPRTRVE
jgi:hypothetical protein